MRITIDIDNYSADFDYIIDFVANKLKHGELSGNAETDGAIYSWFTEKESA